MPRVARVEREFFRRLRAASVMKLPCVSDGGTGLLIFLSVFLNDPQGDQVEGKGHDEQHEAEREC